MELRCPVCGATLGDAPAACADCTGAASPRSAITEYLSLALDRSYHWSRARTVALLTWTALNLALGLGLLLINGRLAGFYLLPLAGLSLMRIRASAAPIAASVLAALSTALPAVAGLVSLNRTLRADEQRRRSSSTAFTRRERRELLRSLGPVQGRAPVSRALGPASRAVAVVCALAAAQKIAQFVALRNTSNALLQVELLPVYAGVFAVAAGALWSIGDALTRSHESDRRARELAATRQAELDAFLAEADAPVPPGVLEPAAEDAPRATAAVHPAVKRAALAVTVTVLLVGLAGPLGYGQRARVRLATLTGFDPRSTFRRLSPPHEVTDAWVVTPVLMRQAPLDGLDRRLLSNELALTLRLAGKRVLEQDLVSLYMENTACFKTGATPSRDELESMAETKRAAHVLIPIVSGATATLMRHDFDDDAYLTGSEEVVSAPLDKFVRAALQKLEVKLPRYENLGRAFSAAPPRSLSLFDVIQQRALTTADDWARQGQDLAILGHHLLVEGTNSGYPLLEKGLAMTELARLAAPAAVDVLMAHALALILAGRYTRAVPLLEPLAQTSHAARELLAVARPHAVLPDPETAGYLYRLAVERDLNFVFSGRALLEVAARSSNADMVFAGLVNVHSNPAAPSWERIWSLEELGADPRRASAVQAAVEVRARARGVDPVPNYNLRDGVLETRVPPHLVQTVTQQLLHFPARSAIRASKSWYLLRKILPMGEGGVHSEQSHVWSRYQSGYAITAAALEHLAAPTTGPATAARSGKAVEPGATARSFVLPRGVVVLPLVDDAGTIVPLGATLALLGTYQAAFVPRQAMALSVQQVRDAFAVAGCFLPGARLNEDRLQRVRRALGRDVDVVTARLTRAGERIQVMITDGTSAPAAQFPLAEVAKVPSWIATQLHQLRGTPLSDDERATLARADVPALPVLAQVDELACGWRGVPAELDPSVRAGCSVVAPRPATEELERWREIARASPDSSYIAYQWLLACSSQRDPATGAAVTEARSRFSAHPYVQSLLADLDRP